MTLGTDLRPRRPLYFVSFVSSQSIKTGVQPAVLHIPYRSMNWFTVVYLCQGTYWCVNWKKTIITAIIASLQCCRRGTRCFAKDTSSTTQTWKHQQPLHTTCWTLGRSWKQGRMNGTLIVVAKATWYSTFPLALTIGYSYVVYCYYWILLIPIDFLSIWYTHNLASLASYVISPSLIAR